MEERNQEVLARVREELERRPHLKSGVLFHMARQIDPAIGTAGPEFFHRLYVLPVRHEQASRAPKQARKRKTQTRQSGTRQRRGVHRPPRRGVADELPQAASRDPAVPREVPEPLDEATDPLEERTEPVEEVREEPGAGRDGSAPPDRRQIRALFLRFAQDLAGAQRPAEIVRVIASVDQYLDQLLPRDR